MTLAVAERVVRLLAAGKVAILLGAGNRSERSAGIVLRSMSDAPTAVESRPLASLEAANAFSAIEWS
jgi:hypothetical protein